jgi:hypothetical protein
VCTPSCSRDADLDVTSILAGTADGVTRERVVVDGRARVLSHDARGGKRDRALQVGTNDPLRAIRLATRERAGDARKAHRRERPGTAAPPPQCVNAYAMSAIVTMNPAR